MRKNIILFAVPILAFLSLAPAPDRRISDNDGDVLNINASDGSIPVSLVGGVSFPASTSATVVTFTADDATPTVASGDIFTTAANTNPLAITDLDDPTPGQTVTIVGGSSTNGASIADSGNFNLAAARRISLDDVIVLYVQADNDYIEKSFSDV